MQTDATRTCELLVGLRDVTVLGVGERHRQPLEVCVDYSDGSRVHAPEVPDSGMVHIRWSGTPNRACG